jgi:hypothetical protein
MNRDEKLVKALRELAEDAPRGAPAEVGIRVGAAFARRRALLWRRRAGLVTVAAAAILVTSLMWMRRGNLSSAQIAKQQAAQNAAQPLDVAHADEGADHSQDVSNTKRASNGRQLSAQAQRHQVAATSSDLASNDFIALPTFDPAIPVGPSRIVRVELPGSSLQLVGYPVNAEMMDRRVVTDLLLGQDGRPYAVRLVPTQIVH